ncbi:MAG: hypothetical protein Q7T04_00285 [Dehalococcoidia bacterium]|nr:hypothetical protein [Dehalococcoidia bacterium]
MKGVVAGISDAVAVGEPFAGGGSVDEPTAVQPRAATIVSKANPACSSPTGEESSLLLCRNLLLPGYAAG